MRVELPPPINWQDFENLCLEVWKSIWSDPDAKKNGRQGQPQSGVDIFNHIKLSYGEFQYGVQCKLKSQLQGDNLTKDEILEEVHKAETFRPVLHDFTIATTAKRDVNIQRYARWLSNNHQLKVQFSVQIYSWDDICDVITARNDLLHSLYDEYFTANRHLRIVSQGVYEGSILGRNPIVECEALFDAPEVRGLLTESLRVELRNVMTELTLNAFEHGNAKRCVIRIDRNCLTFADNGRSFDALSKPSTKSSGVGLLYFHQFLAKWASYLECSYVFENGWNQIIIKFPKGLSSLAISRECVIQLREGQYSSYANVKAYAEIPDACKDYMMDIPMGAFNPSSLVDFLNKLLHILSPDAKISLHFAPNDLMRDVLIHMLSLGWFSPGRLVVTE